MRLPNFLTRGHQVVQADTAVEAAVIVQATEEYMQSGQGHIVIPSQLTGRRSLYLNPRHINELIIEGSKVMIYLDGSQTITFDVPTESRQDAVKTIVGIIFTSTMAEKVEAIRAATGRWLHPLGITSLDLAGGVIQIGMRDGRTLQVGGAHDAIYAKVVTAVFGPTAAEEVGVAPIPKPLPVADKYQKARPKLLTPQTIAEDTERMAAAHRALNPPPTISVPRKVNASNSAACVNGILDVLDELRALMPALQGNETWQDQRSIGIAKGIVGDVNQMQVASMRAASESTSNHFVEVRRIGMGIAEATSRLPLGDEYAQNIKRAIIAQTDRLTTLPTTTEVESLAS